MARGLLRIADGAENETVKLAAIKHALALGGISEKTSVDIEVTVKPYEKMLSGIIVTGMATGVTQEASESAGNSLLIEEPETPALEPAKSDVDPEAIIDAEVVEDQPERSVRRSSPVGQGNGREPTEQPYVPHHITGDAAIHAAAGANRAAGVWPARRR